MIELGSTDFKLAIASVDSMKLESLSSSLFDQWDLYVEQNIRLPDYSLSLQIEEGSINGWGTIKSSAKNLIIGLTAYGGLMGGVEIVSKQLNSASVFLVDQAQKTFPCARSQVTAKRKGGAPASLQRLFSRVQRGELTAEEAAILAESVIGNEAAEVPGFLDTLKQAFKTCPLQPKQTPLPFEDLLFMPSDNKHENFPRQPKKRLSDLPAPLHYRIEVWRDSKKKQKQTKVSII